MLYRLYHSAIINSKKSPAVDANNSVTAAPLPPSWYGMYDNHEGNGDKRSPSHSGGLKVQHGNRVQDPLETNKATENGKRMKHVEAELGFCWERPPFFRCHFPLAFVKQQTLQLGNCEGTTKSPKVGPPGPNNSYLIENDGLSPPES